MKEVERVLRAHGFGRISRRVFGAPNGLHASLAGGLVQVHLDGRQLFEVGTASELGNHLSALAGDLEADWRTFEAEALRDLKTRAGMAFWDAMVRIRKAMGGDRFRSWIERKVHDPQILSRLINVMASNDHNSEFYLNRDLILTKHVFPDGEPVTPEAIAFNFDSMVEGAY